MTAVIRRRSFSVIWGRGDLTRAQIGWPSCLSVSLVMACREAVPALRVVLKCYEDIHSP